MKKIVLATAVCSVLALMVAAPEAEASSQAYSLFCRGNPKGIMNVDVAGSHISVEWKIKHGSAKYDPTTLQPGHCTWVDRKPNSSEPWKLRLVRKYKNHSIRVSKASSGFRLAIRNWYGVQKRPEELKALNNMQSDNFITEFRVVNRTKTMRATNGKKYEDKAFWIESVGVSHQLTQLNRG